jgi:hypothetical protein
MFLFLQLVDRGETVSRLETLLHNVVEKVRLKVKKGHDKEEASYSSDQSYR